ncbi:MAG: rhodanese-related sulfurtransferase [Nitrospirae bacterium]|nr:MAG: rhodanese-related sulfurtransferase [Nitrospirota bacterium]
MEISDLFRRPPSITTPDVHALIEQLPSDLYALLDVRQPAEYEKGHLPGALLIPLSDLQMRLGELDAGKKTIVYCRSGNRSLSAAGMLLSAGFREVLNMDGGILAYKGIVAGGSPEAAMFCVPGSLAAHELLTMAWSLETGTLDFLRGLRADISGDFEALLSGLIEGRESARESLKTCCSELMGVPPEMFPVCAGPHCEGVMAGCIRVPDAQRWAKGRTVAEVLEMLVAMSATAYDHYLRLARFSDRADVRRVFNALAEQELGNVLRTAQALEATL